MTSTASLSSRACSLAQKFRVGLLVSVMSSVVLIPALAEAKPKEHTVYKGQRLGSIAKRYNVSIDELCQANGIKRSDPIHPGQKLVIPGTDDGTGPADKKKDPPRPQGKTRTHTVAKGHTLSAIAGRYAITVTALCNANGIKRSTPLVVGETLIIPHKTDKDGEYARKQRLRGDFEDDTDDDEKSAKKEKSWAKYVKPAWRRGFIKIRRYGRYWEGYVIGPKNQVLGHASNKINFVLGAHDDGPRIDPTLVRMIASISDKFGGREMRIVSGYRTKSFVAASKHKEGKALDFSIPGIPNEALRDYLRTIEGVGVGYYPNSSFVHLDVRGYNSYWVDYAGPGEAPRTRRAKKPSSDSADEHEHEHEADEPEDSEPADEGKRQAKADPDGSRKAPRPDSKTPRSDSPAAPESDTKKSRSSGESRKSAHRD